MQNMSGRKDRLTISIAPENVYRERIEKITKKMIDELLCIKDKRMRSFALANRFKRVKPESAMEVLREIQNKASGKRSGYVEIMESCIDIDLLRQTLGLKMMSDIYSAARRKGYDNLVRLLINPPPKGKPYSEYDFIEGRENEDITLGEKRSFSKGWSRNKLDQLIYDEDPVVIKHLLENPRITERDVLKMSSRRPVKPEVLKVIYGSRKWLSRYVIKKALVLNPYTPTGIALGLVGFMRYKDLKMIANYKSLHEEIRLSAEEIINANYKKP